MRKRDTRNLYQREPGGIWYGRFTSAAGKEIRRSLRTKDEAAARRELRKLRQKYGRNAGDGYIYEDMAISFEKRHLPKLKPKSETRYLLSMDNIGPYLTGVNIEDISSLHMHDFVDDSLERGLSGSSILRDLACLSSMYSHAQSREMTERNPVTAFKKAIKSYVKEGNPRDRYLDHDEEVRLMAATLQDYHLAAFIFAIDVGFRREEQFSAKVKQFDRTQRRISTTENTKSGKKRTVPLTDRCYEILCRLTDGRDPEEYIFAHERKGKWQGKRYITMREGLLNAAETAGINDIRWHDLRRTCGCRLLQDYGMSMEDVCAWLGHSSVKVTERHYAFLDVETLQRKFDERNNMGTFDCAENDRHTPKLTHVSD